MPHGQTYRIESVLIRLDWLPDGGGRRCGTPRRWWVRPRWHGPPQTWCADCCRGTDSGARTEVSSCGTHTA